MQAQCLPEPHASEYTVGKEVNDSDKRNYQMASFDENRFVARHFIAAHAFKAELFASKCTPSQMPVKYRIAGITPAFTTSM